MTARNSSRVVVLPTRELNGTFGAQLHNSDEFSIGYTDAYEFLPLPFRIGPGVTLPVAGYGFGGMRASYLMGQQRKVAGTLTVEHEDGSRGTVSAGDAYRITPGHDAWVEGDEEFVGYEFKGAAEYAKG